MVLPAEYLLKIPAGETLTKVFTWYPDGEDEDPANLSGFTARMQIRTSRTATGDPVLSLTTENGGIVLGDVGGTVTIVIDNSLTDALTIRTGRYDLELVQPNGEPIRFLKGRVVVDAQVTR